MKKIDDIVVRRTKFSTVGLAVKTTKKIKNKGKVETKTKIEVIGTGFFYDTRGYLMSAAHVLRELIKIHTENKFKNIESEMIAINNHVTDRLEIRSEIIEDVNDILFPQLPQIVDAPTRPVIFDVGIAKIKQDRPKYPFLKIRKDWELQIGEEIAMCGFPGGNDTLSFEVHAITGLRGSPVMQFGHIAALLPFDDTKSYGIQTDIISAGGSSGSPIISIETGEVVGIVQKIIPTYARVKIPENVQKKIKKLEYLEGSAHIGLIYGDSCNMISDIPNMTKDNFSAPKNKSHAEYTRVFVRDEIMNKSTTISEDDL